MEVSSNASPWQIHSAWPRCDTLFLCCTIVRAQRKLHACVIAGRRDDMSDIRIGIVGKILAGSDIGWYVRVDDDSANTGGYYIFTAPQPDMRESFDGWVMN